MWQCDYGREPFDMRLFVLLCVRRLWVVLAGTLAGMALVGGIYYVKNVTFGGAIPYTMDSKYYLEYAVDPSDQQTASYFASYTWNDLLKSGDMVEKMLESLTLPMTAEELTGSFEAELVSDLRICYIRTTAETPEKAREIDRVAGESMIAVGERQWELKEVSLLDRGEPGLALPDLRTLRACMLGAALGFFFTLFGLGLRVMLEERVQVPGALTRRYAIPAAGYVSDRGVLSEELESQLDYLLRDRREIGVTAVNGDLDISSVVRALTELKGQREYTAIPSLYQAPEAGDALRGRDAVLLLVQADCDRGKAIEELLRRMEQLDIKVDAMILVGADRRLIRQYQGIGHRERGGAERG